LFIFVKKNAMKKILYIIAFIAFIGCTENTYITEPLEDTEVENPFKDCFNIVSVDTGNPQCGGELGIEVVTNDFFNRGIQSTPNDRTLICITNTDYTINSFILGQLICDLSIYN